MGRLPRARDLFEAARDAALDAHRISLQLAAMEEAETGLGGRGEGAGVRSTPDHQRMAARVAAYVDAAAKLERRQEEDYRIIDAACEVLYGTDQTSGGLAASGPPWVADAIFHHYLALRTWEETAALVCYHPRYVQEQVGRAFAAADRAGDLMTRLGRAEPAAPREQDAPAGGDRREQDGRERGARGTVC